MKIIRLAAVTNVQMVAKALQEATDEVLNAKSLKDLIEYNDQAYQSVHPQQGSVIAKTSIIVGSSHGEQCDMATLSVEITRPGGYSSNSADHYIPLSVINQLQVRLDGGRSFPRHRFSSGPNNTARAMLTLPMQTFVRHPRALIEIAS